MWGVSYIGRGGCRGNHTISWLASGFAGGLVPDAFASSLALGLDPAMRFKPATRLENACASGAAAIYAARDAIAAGRVRPALVIGAEKMTDLDTKGVTEALGRGESIEIRGFGSFVIKEYEAYEGRNPKTGKKILVKPKKLPFFKVGKDLREKVNDGK